MELTPHLQAVLLAYGLGLPLLAGLILWIWQRGKGLKARLAALEAGKGKA